MGESDWPKYEALVGKRWSYYSPRFEKFARGKWLSWNWAAFFGTLAWLRYRKLRALSWLYFFVSTPILLGLLVVTAAGDPCERALGPAQSMAAGPIFLVLLGLQWIVAPLIANRLYFNHVRSLVATADRVAGSGGYAGALALQGLVLVGILAGIPGYAHYTYRAMVSEGVLLAGAARVPVQEYENNHRRLPARIEEVAQTTSSRYVSRLVLEPDGTIRAMFGASGKKLSGHSVAYVPLKQDGRIVDWMCRSTDLPDVCLPMSCRRRGG